MVDNNNWDHHKALQYTYATADHEDEIQIKEHDRLLPIANVGRIMKRILPSTAKISKEAKQTMQECVSEFISFVTCEASDKCHKERRKTVNGDDVCCALMNLGFDDYGEALKSYLDRFREAGEERANLVNQRPDESSFYGGDEIGKQTFSFYLMDEGGNVGV